MKTLSATAMLIISARVWNSIKLVRPMAMRITTMTVPMARGIRCCTRGTLGLGAPALG